MTRFQVSRWDTLPLWLFYLVLYVVAGFVVVASMEVESSRQCAARSPTPLEWKVLAGAAWPATATLMVLCGMHPLAILTPPYVCNGCE